MSLSSPYSEVYQVGDGATRLFAFGQAFTPISSSYVKCIVYFADGTNTVPVFTVDMGQKSITIATLTKADGTVLSAPPANSIVRIFRDVPESQDVTSSQLQAMTSKQLEKSFDDIVAMIQEVSYSDQHKTVRLTETQRDVVLQHLKEAQDQSIIYWDNDRRTLVATEFGQNTVVLSETIESFYYDTVSGKIYFKLRQGGGGYVPFGSAMDHNDLSGRNADDCHPKSAITGLVEDLQALADKDAELEEDVATAIDTANTAKDTANEAKQTANTAYDKAVAVESRFGEIEDTVNTHVADHNNPHQVNKEQVGLGNVDNTADLDKPIIIKSNTIPEASESVAGKIYQYAGTTNSTYTHGYIYECSDEPTYTLTFTPNKMSCTWDNLKAFLQGETAQYNSIVSGTMTYASAGDMWNFVGKDSAGNTVLTYRQYTEDWQGVGFIFTGSFVNGEVISFVRSDTTQYVWTRIDVQPRSSFVQEQADWTQTDATAVDYIKNKPDLDVYAKSDDLGMMAYADKVADGDIDDGTISQSKINGLATALSGKQDKLTAGNGIDITDNTISADNIFCAIYGTTTYDEITQAIADGKMVIAKKEVSGGKAVYYNYSQKDGNNYHRFFSSASSTIMYGITCTTASSWNYSAIVLQKQLTAGTNITIDANNVISATGGSGTITDVKVDGTSVVTDGVANVVLTGKQDKLVSGTNIKTINNNSILGSGNITIEGGSGQQRVFTITEDMVTVTTDPTKGVAPYSTTYGYTNITINADAGIEWVNGGIYNFIVDTVLVVSATYRNVRIRIGENGDWKPVMGSSSTIASGSTYFVKTYNTLFQYKSTYQTNGALHVLTDNNTTYSYLVNTVPVGSLKIDNAGYGARYSLVFPTTPLSTIDERFSSLVKSSSTNTTKVAQTDLTFYADRHPQYLSVGSISAGGVNASATYQDYASMDLRYTVNTNATWVSANKKVFLWLKDFNEADMSFKADATIGNIFSIDKLATKFPETMTEDVYIYFLGWNSATWYTLSPNFTQEDKIFRYTPSTGVLVELNAEEHAGKQDKLTAGDNITIVDNVISATGGTSIPSMTLAEYEATTKDPNQYYAITDDEPLVISDFTTLVNQVASQLAKKVDLPDNKGQDGIDYVVEWQNPTADNNYTWYRKYKSGWVEQGVTQNTSITTAGTTVNLAIPMLPSYMVTLTAKDYKGDGIGLSITGIYESYFTAKNKNYGSSATVNCLWQVSGQGA